MLMCSLIVQEKSKKRALEEGADDEKAAKKSKKDKKDKESKKEGKESKKEGKESKKEKKAVCRGAG
jgi:hypothetical protein